MKILMVASYLPYPLYSGGQVRLFNLIKELSAKHEITLICEKRKNQTDEDIKAVEAICSKVITVPRRKQWSVRNVFKAGTSNNSFLVTGHTHQEMQQKIQEELSATLFELIHVETYYVYQNLPKVFIPVVLVEHNIEYKVYERYLHRAPVFLKPLLAVDILKIKKEEEEFWQSAEVVAAVSKDDLEVIQQTGINPVLIPNGVNTDFFSFKDTTSAFSQKEKKILFIGDFKWIQNKDSATFIIREIWPKLKAMPFFKLWIVGRNIPSSIRSLTSDPRVLFDEESSSRSTPEIFKEASVLLAPIRVGGGTSYKILESMACGTPVVTMQLSADALEANDGSELLIGQSAEELADKTIQVLSDKALYDTVTKGGRTFVEEQYTWKEIARKLDEVYGNLIKSK